MAQRPSRSPQVHFVTFGEGTYARKALQLKAFAEKTGFFDQFHIFTELPESVLTDARWKKHLQAPRGFGYWFWKSVLTSIVLETIADGDVLVYQDAGGVKHSTKCCPTYASWTEWGNLLEAFCDHDLLVNKLHWLEWQWSKGDILRRFNLTKYTECPYSWGQVAATSFMMKRSPSTLKFMALWRKLVSDFHLISDQPSHFPNLGSYSENRHDQSLFSMLVKSSNPQISGSPSQHFELNAEFGIEHLRPLLFRGYPPFGYNFRVTGGSNHLSMCSPNNPGWCREEARRMIRHCNPPPPPTHTNTTTTTTTITTTTTTTTPTILWEFSEELSRLSIWSASNTGQLFAGMAILMVVIGAYVCCCIRSRLRRPQGYTVLETKETEEGMTGNVHAMGHSAQ